MINVKYSLKKALPKEKEQEVVHATSHRRPIQEIEYNLWKEPDSKATFTFKLRPRLIQSGIGVKLLACLSGKPTPTVQWFKDNKEISETNPHYSLQYSCGVCTLEIASCVSTDAGTYTCKAQNILGTDETYCRVSVEGNLFK